MAETFILINPQWQGGGDTITYDGAEEVKKLYLSDAAYTEAQVSMGQELSEVHGIIGFEEIEKQMQGVSDLLYREGASKIFSVGGGCDADVPVIAYLNEKYNGTLLVLWCDAHGDLNAPDESTTGLFYGMPARVLMDDRLFSGIIRKPLTPQQLIQIGGRELDEAEELFIQKSGLMHIAVPDLKGIASVLRQNQDKAVYIHLDLDVLDPKEFPHTPLPVANGATKREIQELIRMVSDRCKFVGLGLYEYAPCGKKTEFISQIIEDVLK